MTRLKTTNWDAVIASAPLDRQASIIRDGRGEALDVVIENSFKECPPLRPYSDVPANDLRGKRFGSLVAIGLSERTGTNGKGAGWVFQCDCGHYTRMSKKGVERQVAIDRARCGECDYIEGVRKGRILPREERLRLRHERAESDGTAEFDAAAHPYFAKLLTDWEREGIEAAAVFKSMARWMTYEKGRRRAAPDESQAASDLKAEAPSRDDVQER